MIHLSLAYPVRSNIKLPEWKGIKDGDTLIEFTPDDHGRIARIRVSVPAVPTKPPRDPEIPMNRQAPEIMQPTIDHNATQKIEEHTLSIEALLHTFVGDFEIDRTQWQMKWCTDNTDELQSIRGPSVITASPRVPASTDVDASLEDIHQWILRKEAFKDLLVPLVFRNHALKDMSEQRLIPAYYNFFFVLEVLFAPGYSSPKTVERCFLSSPVLNEAINDIRAKYNHDILTSIGLKHLLSTAQCEPTTEGIIRFLIRTRGRLHHANRPISPSHWLPTHMDRFHHEVHLIHSIVDAVINMLIPNPS